MKVRKPVLRTFVPPAFYPKFHPCSNVSLLFGYIYSASRDKLNLKQYCCQTKRGAVLQLVNYLKAIYTQQSDALYVVYFDFAKVFVKVPHNILINKLCSSRFDIKFSTFSFFIWMVGQMSQSKENLQLLWTLCSACHKAQLLVLLSFHYTLLTLLRSLLMPLLDCLLMTPSSSSKPPTYMIISTDYTTGTYLTGC